MMLKIKLDCRTGFIGRKRLYTQGQLYIQDARQGVWGKESFKVFSMHACMHGKVQPKIYNAPTVRGKKEEGITLKTKKNYKASA